MTDLERQALDVLEEVLDQLAPGRKVSNKNYIDVMSDIRNLVLKLRNIRAEGCATGMHRGKCTCRAARLGVCVQ